MKNFRFDNLNVALIVCFTMLLGMAVGGMAEKFWSRIGLATVRGQVEAEKCAPLLQEKADLRRELDWYEHEYGFKDGLLWEDNNEKKKTWYHEIVKKAERKAEKGWGAKAKDVSKNPSTIPSTNEREREERDQSSRGPRKLY